MLPSQHVLLYLISSNLITCSSLTVVYLLIHSTIVCLVVLYPLDSAFSTWDLPELRQVF